MNMSFTLYEAIGVFMIAKKTAASANHLNGFSATILDAVIDR
ncbi:hypothetical protein B4099_2748 [Heyndrickxia coagulans]|uniref:Uncharacterized protein n=1 Tax=Heyndrickxia coagulans TaxID=1398 RepID=A0A150KIW1_HEYCO|nr:hypothetical protein B4099_2748 [Heyndrickxia coagulans]